MFKEGQSAVTSGQSIVFYKNKKLIGGGIIYE
ncbi:MAG: aminomethyltransferase beta-barrel domain-containing protein [Minisyncoccales bacterium]